MKNDWPTALKLGAVLLTVFVLSKCFSGGESQDQSTTAQIQCKDFLIDRLKAPSTAQFASYDAAHVSRPSIGLQQYIIGSYLDAQNSFGAVVRSRYICEVEWNGRDSSLQRNWTLLNLTVE